MSKYFWLLDAGHGGVIDGVPQTAGKRSPDWEKGILYEGVSNRRIVDKVKALLDEACITNFKIVTDDKDTSLAERVRRVNAYPKTVSVLLSFHSDAFNLEQARGWSAFTTTGKTKSDKVAEVLYKHARKARWKVREDYSDGDADKEANFYVLRKTNCPAVLIENFFMTNKKDYAYLMSKKGQDKIAKVIFDAIQEIENYGL